MDKHRIEKKKRVKGIEVIGRDVFNEDGFLRLEKMTLKNIYEDGTSSRSYKTEMVHRRGIDSVAIIPYFFDEEGRLNIFLKRGIRPAVYFRKNLPLAIPDSSDNLYIYEAIAGSLEEEDRDEQSVAERASKEIFEELGFRVKVEDIEDLGGGFYPSHGQSSEKIHLRAISVRPEEKLEASGDGSVSEQDSRTEVIDAKKILEMCSRGEIEDPKIEIGVSRLCKKLQY
ncbi:MAG: hypothetical protein AB1756_04915 [Acidobacteriota bacterium]